MGLQLPDELRSLLGILGFNWPEADEQKLAEMGQAWMSFAGTLGSIVGTANAGAAPVWTGNSGADITAFQQWWSNEEGPVASIRDGVPAATLTGTGLVICGMIVLALKIAVIVQLVILAIQIAQAIATAAVSFGATLLEIPIFQQLARTVVSNLFQEVLFTLLEA
ncbi:hypothetical protein [Micromonospora sp. NPDC050276]|uniref:WXG100-like domain-containing protein n=1 Tax=Micromonospora sp. NPDC050276 TaxID=3364278 RepID=UPI0037AA85CC